MIVRGALGFCNWGIISLLDVRQFFSYSLGGKGISCTIIRPDLKLQITNTEIQRLCVCKYRAATGNKYVDKRCKWNEIYCTISFSDTKILNFSRSLCLHFVLRHNDKFYLDKYRCEYKYKLSVVGGE